MEALLIVPALPASSDASLALDARWERWVQDGHDRDREIRGRWLNVASAVAAALLLTAALLLGLG